MFCFDMLLVLLALQSLALYTTCAVITARANTCFALTCAAATGGAHSPKAAAAFGSEELEAMASLGGASGKAWSIS